MNIIFMINNNTEQQQLVKKEEGELAETIYSYTSENISPCMPCCRIFWVLDLDFCTYRIVIKKIPSRRYGNKSKCVESSVKQHSSSKQRQQLLAVAGTQCPVAVPLS